MEMTVEEQSSTFIFVWFLSFFLFLFFGGSDKTNKGERFQIGRWPVQIPFV